jgi:hypothetical protein
VVAPVERPVGTAPRRPEQGRIEAGGILGQGLDAADSPTRLGGFYAGGRHRLGGDVELGGRYDFASGHVTARIPGNRGGQFGVPNDVDVLETRHLIDVSLGYRLRPSRGVLRPFALPFLGPRFAVLVNDVAPRFAFEGQFGALAGVSGDALEASALLAYAPAIAKTHDGRDVFGPIEGELRFGARAVATIDRPLGLSIAYEGDVFVLEHQRTTAHELLVGLTYAIE